MIASEASQAGVVSTLECRGSTGVDRRAQFRDVVIIGWLLVAAMLFLVVCQSFQVTAESDFVQMYSFGRLLNHHPAGQLYNFAIQQKVSAEVKPLREGAYGPTPYPPFVALFFEVFSRLDFPTAYHVWMLLTIGLYLSGLLLLMNRFLPRDALYRSAWACGALLFWPFMGRTLLNGQLAGFGFFVMSLAIYWQDRRWCYLSGLALSACCYKPTLLIWVVPLLVVYGSIKTLCGFGFGVAALLATTVIGFGGTQIFQQYLHALGQLGRWEQFMQRADRLDLLGFWSIIFGTPGRFSGMIALLIGAALIFLLWRLLLTRQGPNRLVAAWAITLTCSLVVNVYTQIYDSTLLIVGMTVTAEQLRSTHPRLFRALCALVLPISYSTTWVASEYKIQMLTVFLGLLAVIQARAYLCQRLIAISADHPTNP